MALEEGHVSVHRDHILMADGPVLSIILCGASHLAALNPGCPHGEL